MTVYDLVLKFEIDPKKDIIPNFRKVKEIQSIEAHRHKDSQERNKCFNCDDTRNNRFIPSIAWTSVQYCWSCKSLNVVYIGDRMGGSNDLVRCYQE